jgi:hypothetical protein
MKKISLAILLLTAFLCLIAQEAVLPLGEGTEQSPYQISSWQNLYWMSVRDSSYDSKMACHYVQTSDISFPAEINTWDENKGWNGIGWGSLSESHAFTGVYNGQNHTITNLFINRPEDDMLGLFGNTNAAHISNLGLDSVSVTASYGPSGLVGEMDGSSVVNNCFVKGNITGEAFVGGITGYNNASTITDCYFIGNITGTEGLGGITGYNDAATISNCYSVAVVSEGDLAGVLIGCNDAGTVNNSFWDADVCALDGIGDNSEGTANNTIGKTTQEMKTQATFETAGWNFTTTWQINPNINSSYPSLIWEHTTTSTNDITSPIEVSAKLHNAYPNPFNPSTTISFELKNAEFVNLSIFNAKGQKVKTLTNSLLNAGTHSITWNGSNDNNNKSASGIYFIKLQTNSAVQIKKAVLVK